MEVKEGDVIDLGDHRLRFYAAPMVHWPEVMVAFEESESVLFSADAFGRFGAVGLGGGWDDEARRYYANIVGKYGRLSSHSSPYSASTLSSIAEWVDPDTT